MLATVKRILVLWTLCPCLYAAQPNILFILAEDHGAHFGAMGRTDVKTPRMDALASSAALFRRAYVAYPVCSASKACIMTGLHGHTNGLINNTNNFFKPAAKLTEAEKKTPPYLHTRVRTAAPTMIETLVQNGYHTAVSGKLHLSPNERFPYHDFIPKVPAKQALTGIIKRAAGKPWFFLHNSITSTHRPFVNSEKQPIGIDPAQVTLPAHLPDTPTIRRDWAEYLDGIQKADRQLGEVLDTLRDSGAESNTIVIYMGDHGPAYPHGKMTPYHLGLHIPLIIQLPGAKPLISDALVSELDLLPTLLDLLQIKSDAPTHGKSLRPILEAQKKGNRSRLHLRRSLRSLAQSNTRHGRTRRARRHASPHPPQSARRAQSHQRRPPRYETLDQSHLRRDRPSPKRVSRCLPHVANHGPACVERFTAFYRALRSPKGPQPAIQPRHRSS